MAEYITIMIINNKTPGEYSAGVWRNGADGALAQISQELEDRECIDLFLHAFIDSIYAP
jgi:hypothetical protein